MKRVGAAKTVLFIAIFLVALSVVLAVISLYPVVTDGNQSSVIIDDSFVLKPNEIRRQGIGSFHGGENISLLVECPRAFEKNFSIATYNGYHYNTSSTKDIAYDFTAGADYYEVIFSNASKTGAIHFEVTLQQVKVLYPFSWLTTPARIMFLLSLGAAMLVLFKLFFSKPLRETVSLTSLGQIGRRRLLALVLLSLVCWFLFLAVNSNPLATFENWYTDHARHSYASNLFLKDGFSVFSEPLGKLASQDSSHFMFVTWPEMPHLYPIGSIMLFLPFGVLLQSGVAPVLVYKLEIALFLVLAHVCLYLFLNHYWKKEFNNFLKLVGVYIIYVTLVIYAANGMFDSAAILFSLFALTALVMERYDSFFLLVAISVLFKYQTAIFLLPLIIVGVLALLQKNKIVDLLRNKAVVLGLVFVFITGFTAYWSAPYLMATRPELVMNGINAFSAHSQIPWNLQSFSVLLTLAVTLAYALYMLNKNSLLSLSALFLLFPCYTLPFFQNWYISFLLVYMLIPQRKKELEITMLWLIFMIAVLSFGGVSYNPLHLFDNFKSMFNI